MLPAREQALLLPPVLILGPQLLRPELGLAGTEQAGRFQDRGGSGSVARVLTISPMPACDSCPQPLGAVGLFFFPLEKRNLI